MLAQNVPAPLFTRGMALLSVAIYDATVAAWDSKYAYNRPRPNAADKTINPLVAVPNSPSYPSDHAVAAGAASVVLAYLFPNIGRDRKSTRLNSSHTVISYAVFCLRSE